MAELYESMLQKLFGFLTLGMFNISLRRKYTFVITLFLLLGVLILRFFVSGLFGYQFATTPFIHEFLDLTVIALATNIILNIIRLPIVSSYRFRNEISVDDQDNFILGLNSIVVIITTLSIIIGTFIVFDIEFQTFLTSISLFAVALVLIFREYINNFLDSFVLMFSEDYKIGDYIKLNETSKGIIRDITFRSTKIRTDDGVMLFIPNNKILTSHVINYSKVKYKRIIVPFSLTPAELPDLPAFEAKLVANLIEQFPDIVIPKKVYLRVTGVTEFTIDMALEVSISKYNFTIDDQITKFIYTYIALHRSDANKAPKRPRRTRKQKTPDNDTE